MKVFVQLIFIGFGVVFFLSSALANSPVVRSIKVTGNQKIEEAAITHRLVTKIDEPYDLSKIRQDVRELYSMGFFQDVIVEKNREANAVHLVYKVVEKPTMTSINFIGNSDIKDDELLGAAGIKVFEILNMAKIGEAVEKMEKLYEDKGFFLARVTYEVTEQPNNTTEVTFNITENEKVKVSRIRFLGNEGISSGRLKNAMQTKEGGFFSFMSGTGSYREDVFERDIQMLYYLIYYNEGYIQAQIDRPLVQVTPDKRHINITIRIDEGEKYNVGDVSFTGDLLFEDSDLYDSISVRPEDLFVYSKMQEDLRTLQAKYGDLGYAYANIIPRTRIRERDRLVDITFEVDKGNKVFINRINVKGNTKTRDKVLRREMRIFEGELYNETRRRQSESNIRRLGFFDEVVFNTKAPPGRPDLMDIDIVVTERNTGTISLGAGFSNFGGFILNGQINQINLFGRGQRLGLSIDHSKFNSVFNLNFTEPYFMDTEWSVGGDTYYRRRDSDQAEFREKRYGAGVRVGHPLAPYLEGSVGYKLDETRLTLNPAGDPDLFPVETANGRTSALTFALTYDRRDDRFAPKDGVFSSVSLEYAGLGGDLDYTKGLATARYYRTLFWDVVWRNNLNYGIIASNDSDREVPFNQLFLLGGANSLRGYRWFSVGRRKLSEKALAQNAGQPDAEKRSMIPFGGKQQFYYNLEFQFPLIREAQVQGVVFYDIGYADDDLKLSDFRSNVGFGFRWFSPIGPLRFEWGFPFNRVEALGERAVNFEFAIGSPF